MKQKLAEYNPLEIDDGGWIPIRKEVLMSETPKKSCTLCEYAPAITFVFADLYAGYHGYIHEPMWLVIQLLIASMYIKDINTTLFDRVNGKIKWNNNAVMLLFMVSITLRAIFFSLLFS